MQVRFETFQKMLLCTVDRIRAEALESDAQLLADCVTLNKLLNFSKLQFSK